MKMLLRGFCLSVLLLVLCSTAHSQALFFQPPSYAGSGETISADFNHDGKVDLTSADGTVLLGNGDGTFTAAPSLGFSGTQIAIADFNGDGKPDILLNTMVFLGNGDGTFQSPLTSLPALNSPTAVADVNGDGKPDVLVLVSGSVVVFLGKGDGTFTTTNLSYGTSGTALAVGDFNGDGKIDILLANGAGLVVLLGNGDGTFQPPMATGIGDTGTATIVVKDVNGDGKLDVLVGGSTQVSVFLGKGDGTFDAPTAPIPAFGAFTVADVNGDGKPDLVSSAEFTEIFLGNGDGTFTLKSSVFGAFPTSSSSVLVGDFNGDGKADIAAANALLFGNGDGTFQGNPALPLGVPPTESITGDFNGDASLDIAIAPPGGNNLYILLNQGNGSFVVAYTYALAFSPQSIATADINRDGKLDLLLTVADASTGDLSLDVMLGNGDGSFAAPTPVLASIPSALNQSGAADLNGDHVPDLAFSAPQGLEVFLGKGDGTFGSPVVYPSPTPSDIFTADFNGDGIVDVLMGGSIFLGKGDGTFQAAIALTAGCVAQSIGDVNGDGKADLVGSAPHQTNSGSQSYELDVCLSNGDGTFTALLPVGGFDKFITFPFIADINGDGKADLVELGGISGGFGVLVGNGDGTFPTEALNDFGIPVSPVQIADFTGDGRPDALVYVSSPSGQMGLITLINASGALTPDFAISAAAVSPESIVAGATATTTVTLAPANGFSTAVTLSCSGLPAGANCSFTPPAVPGGSGTSAVTLSAGASTPAGTYFVSIVGTSAVRTHATLKTLTVTSAPPPPPDFSLAPASSATATVTAGQTATYMLSLGAAGGFSGNVALSCSGAPTTATCNVSPAMVSVGGATAAAATVSVATTARSELPFPAGNHSPREFPGRPTALLGALMAMLILAWTYTTRRNQLRWAPVLTMVLVLVLGITLTSCGGGSSSGGGGTVLTGTQAGTYTITVSATATAGSTTLSHSTTLTLVVQ
jgi:hypothetical protein